MVPIAILVVEDEALIRLDVVELFKEAGYSVYEASDADNAIRLLERHDDIRLVFTDIDMPGSIDGLKLAHYVRFRWPPVRLLVTSGKQTPKNGDLPPGCVFVPKPYRADRILEELQQTTAP